MYEERTYRYFSKTLFSCELEYNESDILVCSDKKIDKKLIYGYLKEAYSEIKRYCDLDPEFQAALSPIKLKKQASDLCKQMAYAGELAEVGPFAAVAGAVAKSVGERLADYANELIIENGGDIFFKIIKDREVGVFAGDDFSCKIKIRARDYSFGIASSSALFGHSLSFGAARMVTVIGRDVIVADAFATALTNNIKKKEDINMVIEKAKANKHIEGLLVFFDKELYIWGDVELV